MGAGGGSAGDGGAGGGAVTVTRGAVGFFMTRPAVGAGQRQRRSSWLVANHH